MFFRVAVCDDNEFFRERLQQMIEEYGEQNSYHLEVHAYGAGEDLVEEYNKKFFNILFLDIDMGDCLSGIQIAKKLRELDNDVVIIFATSFDEYAVDAFEVSAMQYLIKPIKEERVTELLDKALKQIQVNMTQKLREQKRIVVETIDGLYTLMTDDVIYIEKNRNHVIYHTYQGDFYCYDTIKELKMRLNPVEFAQINQGEIVNWSKVVSVGRNKVILRDCELAISRTYQTEVRERYRNDVILKARDIFWED